MVQVKNKTAVTFCNVYSRKLCNIHFVDLAYTKSDLNVYGSRKRWDFRMYHTRLRIENRFYLSATSECIPLYSVLSRHFAHKLIDFTRNFRIWIYTLQDIVYNDFSHSQGRIRILDCSDGFNKFVDFVHPKAIHNFVRNRWYFSYLPF